MCTLAQRTPRACKLSWFYCCSESCVSRQKHYMANRSKLWHLAAGTLLAVRLHGINRHATACPAPGTTQRLNSDCSSAMRECMPCHANVQAAQFTPGTENFKLGPRQTHSFLLLIYKLLKLVKKLKKILALYQVLYNPYIYLCLPACSCTCITDSFYTKTGNFEAFKRNALPKQNAPRVWRTELVTIILHQVCRGAAKTASCMQSHMR